MLLCVREVRVLAEWGCTERWTTNARGLKDAAFVRDTKTSARAFIDGLSPFALVHLHSRTPPLS